jgi:hypothetical protein
MMNAVTNSLEIPVIQNLNELSIALEQGKKKCDQIVFTVPDSKIRKSLLRIEGSIIRLYGKILNNPIFTEQLRDLMRSQMIGIMGSTQHLKLLSKLLYTQ